MADDRIVRSLTHGLPAASLIGNLLSGTGPARPVALGELAAALATTGQLAASGAPANLGTIADQRVLGNGSGASATPVALSITQPAAGLTVAWAAGGITLALANDLAGVEGLGTTGLAARTAANTWTTRTITGTADKIDVTNGDGVSGNPTLTLSATYAGQASITTLGTVTAGTWSATISGAVLPNSGQITSSGQIGIGAAAASDLFVKTTGAGAVRIDGPAGGSHSPSLRVDLDGTQYTTLATAGFANQGVTGTATGDSVLKNQTGTKIWIGFSSTPTAVFNSSGGIQLLGSTSGGVTVKAAAVAGTNTITLPAGTTDFSATGATGAFVKQASAGAAFTVAVPTISEIAGLGTNVATFLATPSSANLAAALTGETGSGGAVFDTNPTISGLTLSGTTTLPGTENSIRSTGQLFLGNTSSLTIDTFTNTQIALRIGELGTGPVLAIVQFNNSVNSGFFTFAKSRGSAATAAAVQSDDNLAAWYFDGDDGSTNGKIGVRAAEYYVQVDGTVSTNIVPGRHVWWTMNTGGTRAERLRLFSGGDFRVGSGSAYATTATDGFLLIPTCAGAPTGTPTNAGAGQIPIIYDKTNNKLYAYNGAWKSVTLA